MKLKSIVCSALSLFCAGFSSASPLEVGADAPKLIAKDQDGKDVDLAAKFARGLTLVYFYPKSDTPGCTKQACNLRDAFENVRAAGIEVIGVSADKPTQQKAFASKYQLPFTLLADSDAKVMQAFGVPARAGRFAARQSFLIKDGKVIWVDLKASPASQSQDAIAAAAKAK
ncbi:MAG: peroxiredoxin [Rubritalea sp.]|uniref:peroxiredoxin n=1 Tax=Rubritalea sp. TaxID=2109375 RepID=UPI00324250B1